MCEWTDPSAGVGVHGCVGMGEGSSPQGDFGVNDGGVMKENERNTPTFLSYVGGVHLPVWRRGGSKA